MVVDGRRLVTALRNEFGDCLYLSQVVHPAGRYPCFLNMKRLGVSLIPPGWDAGPLKAGKPPPLFPAFYQISLILLRISKTKFTGNLQIS